MRAYIDEFERTARAHAEKPALTFLVGGAVDTVVQLTYRQLLERAKGIATELGRNASYGDRAILLYPPGVEFFEAFLGCLFAGVVAVPMFPPTRSRLREASPRLVGMFRSAAPRVILTPSAVRSHAELLTTHYEDVDLLHWVHNDTVDARAHHHYRRPHDLEPSTTAFLQYTSGSTGTPKGAIISQANLSANVTKILEGFDFGEPDTICHWLPAYHDMGLIGCSLAPLRAGCHIVFMSPWDFLRRPSLWLKAFTHFKATGAAAPNFAFELCARRVRDSEKATLDLSSWRLALNGSEPINGTTLGLFADTFEPYGFRRSSFRPCYGLAESTLVVSGAAAGPEPKAIHVDATAFARNHIEEVPKDHPEAKTLVGSGRIMKDVKVAIVDPNTGKPVPDGEIGEIWTRSDSVSLGYWRNDDATEETFGARLPDERDRYLRTGDLGFVRDGVLFVTGRIKDLIIWHGVNYYPHDIEAVVENVEGVRSGRSAAFALTGANEERVVIVVEYDRRAARSEAATKTEAPVPSERRWNNEMPTGISLSLVSRSSVPDSEPEQSAPPMDLLIRRIKEEVTTTIGLPVYDIVLATPGSIPRTSSGKTRRGATRDLYLSKELPLIASALLGTPPTRASQEST